MRGVRRDVDVCVRNADGDPRCGFGFPRSYRLLEGYQFQRVLGRGQRFNVFPLRVAYRLNEVGHARLGLAVSRRVARRAVDRTRIRRVVRESFRYHADRIPPYDIVINPRLEAISLSSADLSDSLRHVWSRMMAEA